jgi:hypothetical protein
VIPIYIGETQKGGLGGELFAEFRGLASWQRGERFENDAMLGILPAVRAELRENRGTTGPRVRTGGGESGLFAAQPAEDSGFEVEHFGHVLRKVLQGSAERNSPIPIGRYAALETTGRTKSMRSMATATPKTGVSSPGSCVLRRVLALARTRTDVPRSRSAGSEKVSSKPAPDSMATSE